MAMVKSSVRLEILMHFYWYFVPLFFVVEVISFAYKNWRFPYPSPYLEIEVACLVFYMLAEFCRILIGSYSNKRESWGFMIAFLVMGVAAIMINAFFLSWQTFVLRVDVIVNAIAMTLTALQVLLGLLCTCSFVIVFDDAAAAENLMLGEDAGHPHVD